MSDQTMIDGSGQTVQHTNHWGFHVFSNTPVTGVVSLNSTEWVYEECDYREVANLSYDEGLKYHIADRTAEWVTESDDTSAVPPDDLLEEWQDQYGEFYESQGDTILIGDWLKDNDGLWGADHNGSSGYSAIVDYDTNNVQVVWSTVVTRAALCSPCYPGQCDLDTEGDYLAYDLPLELYGDRRENTNPQLPWGVQLPLAFDGSGQSAPSDAQ